jgi:RNA polymerase sigma factor (sigma-70 family)
MALRPGRLVPVSRPEPVRDGGSWARLVGRVARQTPNPADAADHLHSAYVAMRTHAGEHEIRHPHAFLVRVARNQALNEHKRSRFLAGQPCDILCDGFADPAPLPDEVAEQRARLKHFLADFRRLPARTAEIFLMHRIEGRKYREIAEAVGISESAVEKHIARARRFVAEWAEQEAVVSGADTALAPDRGCRELENPHGEKFIYSWTGR